MGAHDRQIRKGHGDGWRGKKSCRRRLARGSEDDRLRDRHRLGGADLLLSAVQHPVRIDEVDAAGGRLPLRFQVRLWLWPILVSVRSYSLQGSFLWRRAPA